MDSFSLLQNDGHQKQASLVMSCADYGEMLAWTDRCHHPVHKPLTVTQNSPWVSFFCIEFPCQMSHGHQRSEERPSQELGSSNLITSWASSSNMAVDAGKYTGYVIHWLMRLTGGNIKLRKVVSVKVVIDLLLGAYFEASDSRLTMIQFRGEHAILGQLLLYAPKDNWNTLQNPRNCGEITLTSGACIHTELVDGFVRSISWRNVVPKPIDFRRILVFVFVSFFVKVIVAHLIPVAHPVCLFMLPVCIHCCTE